ncbi:frigida-like protein [Anaeramoeba flamelloides]|uniref:Frigida-like protein n=1 Tax=Anaeramoeba flamelloides TaxID=1746091 RepID=A0ABQ8ZCN7_9EUKA|nr:frigida-like protein [Anaeramoeba flamelloides]
MSDTILKIKNPSKIPKKKLFNILQKGGFDVDANLDHQSLVKLFLRIQDDLQTEIASDSSDTMLHPTTILEIEQEKNNKEKYNKKEKGKNNWDGLIHDLSNGSDSDSDYNSKIQKEEEEEEEEEKEEEEEEEKEKEKEKEKEEEKNDLLLTPPNSKTKKKYLGSFFTGSNSFRYKNSSRMSRKKYRTERIQRKRPFEANSEKFKIPMQPNFLVNKKRITNKQKKANKKLNLSGHTDNKKINFGENLNSDYQYQQQQEEELSQYFDQPEIELHYEKPARNTQDTYPEEQNFDGDYSSYISFPQSNQNSFHTQAIDDQEYDELKLNHMNEVNSTVNQNNSDSDEIGASSDFYLQSNANTNRNVYIKNHSNNHQNYETQTSWFLQILIILFGLFLVLCFWYLSENYLK